MNRIGRRMCLLLLAATAVLLCAPISLAVAAGPGEHVEFIAPEPTDHIDQYEGSLDPNNALTGSLSYPGDAFDWWCLNVTTGVQLQITLHGSAGARPNCGLVQGIVANGALFEALGPILGATNNGSSETVTLTLIPTFTGAATVWIGNAGTGFNVSYSVSMVGGTVNQSCNPCPDCPSNPAVNFNEKVRFIIGQQHTVGNNIEVPLLVDCGEHVDFTKMTVEYDNTCLSFVSARAGAGVTNPGSVFFNSVPGTVLNSAETVLGTGEYGPACRSEIFVLTFQLVGGGHPPCALVLNRITTGANPPNHVLVDRDQNGVSDSLLVGDANGFCDGDVEVSDILINKTVSNPTPNPGDNITYTITVTNQGPSQAGGIKVTDLLPAGLTYVSSTPSQGTYNSGTGLWTVGSLAVAGVATLQITATVNNGTAGQVINNTATLSALDQFDPSTSNNSKLVSITVVGANLGVTKTVDKASPNVGDTVTYTVTVNNAGPNNATNVKVTDVLPAGVTFVSSAPSQGTYNSGTGLWTVGTINNGGSATLTITATVSGSPAQTVTNTASITGADQADPNTSNNTASVSFTIQSANLGVTKTVSNSTPNVGQSITYTVTVNNAGPNNATNVKVTDVLPAGVTYVSSTPSQGTYNSGTGLWTVGTINNGGSATLTITATVSGTPVQTVTNTASITGADQADPNTSNNTASVSFTIQSANLGVTKTVDKASPNVGDTVTYTVTVNNAGPNNATNVKVTDVLPAGLTFGSANPSQGSYNSTTGLWTVGTVNNGGNATLTITATVNSGQAGQTITNTAAITGTDQADPVPGNNSASVTMQVGCPAVDVAGTVKYYSNDRTILPGIPDGSSVAVTVKDCNNTANNTLANSSGYSLPFGDGPISQICICATRPKADCNGFEGGVISGADLVLLEDIIAQIVTPTPRQAIAADLNRDGIPLENDALAVRQWIGKAAVCSGNTCTGGAGQNCAGTWRFIYPTGTGPSDFVTDQRCLSNVCVDQTVNVQGILLGDVDGSWPNIFPSANLAGNASKLSDIGLAVQSDHPSSDIVRVVLSATLSPGKELHHVIYSLEYDAEAFQYLGAQLGSGATSWGLFDNPDEVGVAHGIAHRLGGKPPITSSGEVIVFEFRMRTPNASGTFNFSRLKANDRDVDPEHRPDATPKPTQYALSSAPNPFNPTTHIRFAIPENAGVVPVTLTIYDISGRLVRALFQDQRGPGFHDVIWTGTDDRGNTVGTGIYFIRMRAGTWSGVKKVMLVK
jgi:uncharacterized repeat protein (TIGR01451 family)